MNRDTVYDHSMDSIPPFEFNQAVANVFDDMVSRSVPFYHEIHRVMLDILDRHYKPGTLIYDLGCSTGTTMSILAQHLKHKNVSLVGCDVSSPMLEKAREKLTRERSFPVELIECRIENLFMKDCGVVIMNYTLQFIPQELRAGILRKIYQALRPGGVFILTEKIQSEIPIIERLQTDLYYDFKRRNGYSELEISQKREALEDILVPLAPEKQLKALKEAGFTQSDMIYKWFNFASYIGIK